MKKKIILLSTALLTAGMLFTSCKKDKDSGDPEPTPAAPVSYAKVKIDSIAITNFSAVDPGTGGSWDLIGGAGADLYIKLDSGSTNVIDATSQVKTDAVYNATHIFKPTGGSFVVTNFASVFSLTAFDDDLAFDQTVASGTFTINSVKTNYPTTPSISLSNSATAKLYLTWYN